MIRTDRGADIWARAKQEGVVEDRPASEDPAAVALMEKLATKQRQRWPTEELPDEWNLPALLPPDGDGDPGTH